jgi:hypothetical protein
VRSFSCFALAAFALTLASQSSAEGPPSKEVCLDAYTRSQPLRRDGKLAEAKEALLICARDPCPAQLQPDCLGWLNEVEQAMPTLLFRVTTSADGDVSDVRVSVDGKLLTPRLDGRALPIDPGTHILRFERAGYAAIEQSIVIHEGEKRRRVSVQLLDPKNKAVQNEPEESKAPVAAYALGGLGLVAFGSFAYFGATGLADRNDLEDCKPRCRTSDVDAVDRKFWIANVSLAVSAVALGSAAVLFLGTSDKPTASARVSATDHGGALSFWMLY